MHQKSEKRPGTVFNVKLRREEGPDGKAKWERIGTVFIRADLSGGAAFIGEDNAQRMFHLFPRDSKPKAKPAPSGDAPTVEEPLRLLRRTAGGTAQGAPGAARGGGSSSW